MKSLVYSLLTAACLMIASSACAFAQSRSIEHDLPPFEGLEVSDGFKITLSKGDSYSAKLTMDDALESYVQCYVKSGVLHIGIDSKNVPKELKKQYKGRNNSEPTLLAVVKVPSIKSISLADDCQFFCSYEIASTDMTMNLTGSASANNLRITGRSFNVSVGKNAKFTNAVLTLEEDLSLACDSRGSVAIEAKAKNVKVLASGGSVVDIKATVDETVSVETSSSATATLSGKAGSLEVTGKGPSSKVTASMLEVESAKLAVSGVAIEVNPSKNLELDLGKGSEVSYSGNPSVNIVKIQNSTVLRK